MHLKDFPDNMQRETTFAGRSCLPTIWSQREQWWWFWCFHVPFNIITVILRQQKGDNERLYVSGIQTCYLAIQSRKCKPLVHLDTSQKGKFFPLEETPTPFRSVFICSGSKFFPLKDTTISNFKEEISHPQNFFFIHLQKKKMMAKIFEGWGRVCLCWGFTAQSTQ